MVGREIKNFYVQPDAATSRRFFKVRNVVHLVASGQDGFL